MDHRGKCKLTLIFGFCRQESITNEVHENTLSKTMQEKLFLML